MNLNFNLYIFIHYKFIVILKNGERKIYNVQLIDWNSCYICRSIYFT